MAQITISTGLDTQIRSDNATSAYFSTSPILVDSSTPISSILLQFDLSDVPAGAVATAAYIRLYTSNVTNDKYPIYQVLRDWISTANATYNRYDSSNNWTTAGCLGAGTDHANTALVTGGVGSTTNNAYASFNLNASGISVLNDWIDGTSDNYGFVLAGTGGSGDGWQIVSLNSATNKPELIITYDLVSSSSKSSASSVSSRSSSSSSRSSISSSKSSTISSSSSTHLETVIITEDDTEWLYNDSWTDLYTDGLWTNIDYDDSGWKTNGQGAIGYPATDAGVNTLTDVDYPSAGNCLYMRWKFNLYDVGNATKLNAAINVDDGAVIYLNGTEIHRQGMAAGTVSYNTLANRVVGTAPNVLEDTWEDLTSIWDYNNPQTLLVNGLNVISISAHNQATSSSDLHCDFRLTIEGQVSETGSSSSSLAAGFSSSSSKSSSYSSLSSSSASLFISLQEGIDGYSGCEDTSTDSTLPNQNGEATIPNILEVDGNAPVASTFIRWNNFGNIPDGATVTAAKLVLYIDTDVSDTYHPIYKCIQPWVADEATHNIYSTGNSWGTAGGQGANVDYDLDGGKLTTADVLGASATTYYTYNFSSAGITALQGWIDSPSTNNNGLVILGTTSAGATFNSSNNPTTSTRPELIIYYQESLISSSSKSSSNSSKSSTSSSRSSASSISSSLSSNSSSDSSSSSSTPELKYSYMITSDIHDGMTKFRAQWQWIKSNLATQPSFMLTCGDNARSGSMYVDNIREILDEEMGELFPWLTAPGNHCCYETADTFNWYRAEYYSDTIDTNTPKDYYWQTIFDYGAKWKYDDGGNYPENNPALVQWKDKDYVDSNWTEGNARLGFSPSGEDNETTVLQSGYYTYCFRKTFTVVDVNHIEMLRLLLVRDDGAIVYINNTEVFRSNMPEGEIEFTTPASSSVASEGENQTYTIDIDQSDDIQSLLVNGSNVIAVEVHNYSNSDTDLGFNMKVQAIFDNVVGTGYNNPSVIRDAWEKFVNTSGYKGPTGSEETFFAFDYGDVRHIILNEYWTGGTGTTADKADGATGDPIGNVVANSLTWLNNAMNDDKSKQIMVYGHEPAFPRRTRHLTDSLNLYEENRNNFWQLLENQKVLASFYGHVHECSRFQVYTGYSDSVSDWNGGNGNVWQFEVGHGGGGDSDTELSFLIAEIWTDQIKIRRYRDVNNDGTYVEDSLLSDPWESGDSEYAGQIISFSNRESISSSISSKLSSSSSSRPANEIQVISRSDSNWKYLDPTQDLYTDYNNSVSPNFTDRNYDETGWGTGPAGLGYPAEATVQTVLTTPPSGSRNTAIYLRKHFNLYNTESATDIDFEVMIDDGAIIYLNGTEIGRYNMAAGTVTHTTLSSATVGTASAPFENTWYSWTPVYSNPHTLLVDGDNVITISAHNQAADSSDLTVDFSMLIYGTNLSETQSSSSISSYISSSSRSSTSSSNSSMSSSSSNHPKLFNWIAYNDCGGKTTYPAYQTTTANVTNYSYQTPTGYLTNFYTGTDTDCTITFSGGSGEGNGMEQADSANTSIPDSGSDAYAEFYTGADNDNPEINFGSLFYGENANTTWTVSFTGLSNTKSYTLCTTACRGRYSDRHAYYTISNVQSGFSNDSSTGVTISTVSLTNDTSYYNDGDNYPDGYVAKWSNIVPNSGTITLTVSGDDGDTSYLTALYLAEEKQDGSSNSSSTSSTSSVSSSKSSSSSLSSTNFQTLNIIQATSSGWLYNDSYTDLYTAYNNSTTPNFTTLDYNDSGWSAGTTAIGYGEAASTNTDLTEPAGDNNTCLYYRYHFDLYNVSAATSLAINVMWDDGGVIYLNGTEIARVGMAAGTVTNTTLTNRNVYTDPPEYTWENNITITHADPTSLLVNGDNVIAISHHNTATTSPDMLFDFSMNISGSNLLSQNPSDFISSSSSMSSISSSSISSISSYSSSSLSSISSSSSYAFTFSPRMIVFVETQGW